jgi:hypothetical protein
MSASSFSLTAAQARRIRVAELWFELQPIAD